MDVAEADSVPDDSGSGPMETKCKLDVAVAGALIDGRVIEVEERVPLPPLPH
jgi:hypothetical protein